MYGEKQMYQLVFSSLDEAFLIHPLQKFHGKLTEKPT